MKKILIAICIIFIGCRNGSNNPLPGAGTSKVSFRYNGVIWESNQPFDGASVSSYNSLSTGPFSSKWITSLTATNTLDNNFMFQFVSMNKPEADSYPVMTGTLNFNSKSYQVVDPSSFLTVNISTITATSASGTFSGKLDEISGGSVVGSIDITEGRFDNIKYTR